MATVNDFEEIMNELPDENEETSLHDIWKQLTLSDELIVTIPKSEELTLRRGLATIKAKANAKLKDAGLEPDNKILKFSVTPSKKDRDAIDVHILLEARRGIRVFDIRVPDNEI